jgi:hypothetical protein
MYIFISSGTDNGKPFDSIENALSYLYNSAKHSKIHLNGVLKDIKMTENSFILCVEQYNMFLGRTVIEIGIRVANSSDLLTIRKYFDINKF